MADKLRRNHDIADVEVAIREQGEDTEGLIRALVDRARSLLTIGDVERSLTDFERVRRLPTSRTYRWWGMEQYASALLKLGRVDEAGAVVDELHREGANVSFVRWLSAQVSTARGHHDDAYAALAKTDALADSLGLSVPQPVLLDMKLNLAVRTGRFDEAVAYLLPLMTTWGRITGRGELLQRLWGDRPADVLAELVLAGQAQHAAQIVDELSRAGGRGPELARLLDAHRRASAPAS